MTLKIILSKISHGEKREQILSCYRSESRVATAPLILSTGNPVRHNALHSSLTNETIAEVASMYDLIGDIHGHADELVQLLCEMGYENRNGAYEHPTRKVIFLGDFIDRGPKIRAVLEIVQGMVKSKGALAVMGNHELNALAFHSEDPQSQGQFLRKHSEKNISQHNETLKQLTASQLATALEWFRTLPMWLDLEGLRVVHACWDERAISHIRQALAEENGLTNSFLQRAAKPGNVLFDSVEVVLKGKEAALPDGIFFVDKDGHRRTQTRVRWYMPSQGQTYRTYAMTEQVDCDQPLERSVIEAADAYPTDSKPVFIGHYWLNDLRPKLLADNVACLDFSVAKGGFLCAYRWHGERKLSHDQFVGNKSVNAANRHAGSAEVLPRNH